MLVMAMSYDGEPLVLTLTGIGSAVYYLRNSSAKNANGTVRNNSGVGFPKSAVFEAESSTRERIIAAYESGDAAALRAAWAAATPLSVDEFEFAT